MLNDNTMEPFFERSCEFLWNLGILLVDVHWSIAIASGVSARGSEGGGE